MFGSARGSDRAILWLAIVFLMCAGYYVAFYRLGVAIDAEHERSAHVATLVRNDAAIVAQRPQIERAERDIDRQMLELQLANDHATTVARFIAESTKLTTAQHVNLVQIDEHPVAGAATPATLGPSTFESVPLEVTLSGSYPNLLATIRALAQAPVALEIDITTIERTAAPEQGAADTPLTAHLIVRLERLRDTPPASSPVHSTAEETTTHA